MFENSQKNTDQLLRAQSTQKLVEMHNSWQLYVQLIKLTSFSCFLRPSQSCARGGSPSRPTLAMALSKQEDIIVL